MQSDGNVHQEERGEPTMITEMTLQARTPHLPLKRAVDSTPQLSPRLMDIRLVFGACLVTRMARLGTTGTITCWQW